VALRSFRVGHVVVQHRGPAFGVPELVPEAGFRGSGLGLRFRAKSLAGFYGLLPESQGRNLALTAFFVPTLMRKGLGVPELVPDAGLGVVWVQGYLAHNKTPSH